MFTASWQRAANTSFGYIPFFPWDVFPFTTIIPSQINSSFLCAISSLALVLLLLYRYLIFMLWLPWQFLILTAILSSYCPFLLSIVSCRFSFCCLVSGTTGQHGPSAYTLLLFVICSILPFLMLLSCQRHCKTEWTICRYTLTHTCLYHLPLN